VADLSGFFKKFMHGVANAGDMVIVAINSGACGVSCFLSIALFPVLVSAGPPPDWITLGVEEVYPKGAYITACGRGKTAKKAEEDAVRALGLYLSAEVSSIVYDRESYSSKTGYDAEAYSKTLVKSEMKLFAMRQAGAWYDGGKKTWRALALIDRAEAWAMFEPRARKEADEFRSLWKAAESEKSALKSYFDYRAAYNFARRDEFVNTMTFGEALYPKKMDALNADVRKNTAQLSTKLNRARNAAQIFISANKDFESNIKGTLTKLLSGEDLIITVNKKRAAAICAATVDEGFKRVEAGYFYYPKISVTITDTRGAALFSYSASADKQGAMDADVAKRRAYGALAAALENNFIGKMNGEL
jgi:hypothetical protein